MKYKVMLRRTSVQIAMFAFVTVVSFVALYKYNYKIEPGYAQPHIWYLEGQWEQHGHLRRQLEDVRLELSPEEYKSRKATLIESGDKIAIQYPRDFAEHQALSKAVWDGRANAETRPVQFWLALIGSVVGTFSTVSAILLGWRADRRTGIESMLKLAELERKLRLDNRNVQDETL